MENYALDGGNGADHENEQYRFYAMQFGYNPYQMVSPYYQPSLQPSQDTLNSQNSQMPPGPLLYGYPAPYFPTGYPGMNPQLLCHPEMPLAYSNGGLNMMTTSPSTVLGAYAGLTFAQSSEPSTASIERPSHVSDQSDANAIVAMPSPLIERVHSSESLDDVLSIKAQKASPKESNTVDVAGRLPNSPSVSSKPRKLNSRRKRDHTAVLSKISEVELMRWILAHKNQYPILGRAAELAVAASEDSAGQPKKSRQDQEKTPVNKRRPCAFFLAGGCRKGNSCPYLHQSRNAPNARELREMVENDDIMVNEIKPAGLAKALSLIKSTPQENAEDGL